MLFRSKTIVKHINDNICTDVADVIDIYINQNQLGDDFATKIDSPELAKLGKSLIPSFNRLSHFLKSKNDNIKNAAHTIKREAYKDGVTELGNRNMFVDYYEKNSASEVGSSLSLCNDAPSAHQIN